MPGSWHTNRSDPIHPQSTSPKPPLPAPLHISVLRFNDNDFAPFGGVVGGKEAGVAIQLPQCGKAIDLSAA